MTKTIEKKSNSLYEPAVTSVLSLGIQLHKLHRVKTDLEFIKHHIKNHDLDFLNKRLDETIDRIEDISNKIRDTRKILGKEIF